MKHLLKKKKLHGLATCRKLHLHYIRLPRSPFKYRYAGINLKIKKYHRENQIKSISRGWSQQETWHFRLKKLYFSLHSWWVNITQQTADLNILYNFINTSINVVPLVQSKPIFLELIVQSEESEELTCSCTITLAKPDFHINELITYSWCNGLTALLKDTALL